MVSENVTLNPMEVKLLQMLVLSAGDVEPAIGEQYVTPELETLMESDKDAEEALMALFKKLGIKEEHMFPEYTPTFTDDEEDEDY